jgi:hypothetical protein
MIRKTALLVLLFASGKLSQAQPGTTVAPVVDENDALLDGPTDGSTPYGCEPSYTAFEKCDLQYNCSAACEKAFEVAADPGEGLGDPLGGFEDASNTTGIRDALKTGFDAFCVSTKEQVCVAKGCCPDCVDELEAALQCNADQAIPFLNTTLVNFLSLTTGLGEAVDAGLGILNDLAGATLNTTIAPTGGFAQDGDEDFDDVFDSLTCDIKDNACDAVPPTPPDETPASGETPAPGETPTPGVTPAPGVTPTPGSPTAPGPSPASSAIMACRTYAVVAMAAVVGIFVI